MVFKIEKCLKYKKMLKRIVSQDFEGLQMLFMNRTWVTDVLLDVFSFLNSCFHIVLEVQSFKPVKLLLMHQILNYSGNSGSI